MDPTVQCISCEEANDLSKSVTCPEKHSLCVPCFQNNCVSQMSTLRLFEERQCKFKCCGLKCSYIFPNGVDYLAGSSMEVYEKSVESVRQEKAQRAQQLECIKHAEAVSMKSKDQQERLTAHFNEIVRQFFDLVCPGCRGGFTLESINYAECTGEHCNCGVIFCLWCLQSVGAGYAEHIKWCAYNPRPGSVTSSLEEMRIQKYNAIRTGVPLYLQSNITCEFDRIKVLERLTPLLLERGITL